MVAIIFTFFAFTIVLTGFKHTGQTKYIGVLYTTEYGNKSQMTWLDYNLTAFSKYSYPFSGASLDGFMNACTADGKIYLIPNVEFDKLDYGKIVIIDPSKEDIKKINIDRTNVTSYSLEGSNMAVASNLNSKFFIDLVNLNNKKKTSMSTRNMVITNIILLNGVIYGTAQDQNGLVFLCSCDMEKKHIDLLVQLPDEEPPFFLQGFQSNLFFLSNHKLIKYDTLNASSTEIGLSAENAFYLHVIGDVLWIGYTDIYSLNGKNYVEARSCETGEVLYQTKYSRAVMQIEGDEKDLFILDAKHLSHYRIDNGAMKIVQKISCKKSGYYPGGIFLTDIQPVKTAAAAKNTISGQRPVITSVTHTDKNRRIRIRYKKLKGAAGYQIQYSASKNFEKKTTLIEKSTSVVTPKLKIGKTCYIRVRAYIKQGYHKYYSKWSKVKKIR